ncbi:hypothetical protein [Thermocrispum municipale]|jgi:hypothetical protein|uniref:hypothetical protein n=1 Tax=Thermocrispum municipale TaxID=37926 RepID=UPI000490C979|nr:hypothetical protein [Thermocrispum municipale]
MYGWIWRHLPGPLAVRVLLAVLLIAAVVALLMLVVFPWLEPMLPFNDVAVGAVLSGAAGTAGTSAASPAW